MSDGSPDTPSDGVPSSPTPSTPAPRNTLRRGAPGRQGQLGAVRRAPGTPFGDTSFSDVAAFRPADPIDTAGDIGPSSRNGLVSDRTSWTGDSMPLRELVAPPTDRPVVGTLVGPTIDQPVTVSALRRRRRLAVAGLVIVALLAGTAAGARWWPHRSRPPAQALAGLPVVGLGPSLPPVSTAPTGSRGPSAAPIDRASAAPPESPSSLSSSSSNTATDKHHSGTKTGVSTGPPPPPRKPTQAPTPPGHAPGGSTITFVGLAGKCLDVANADSADGTFIELFTCNNSRAQSWTSRSDNTLRAYGKCLTEYGSELILSSCTGSDTQLWQVGSGLIVNSQTRLCVGVPGDNSADRTDLIVSGCAPDPGQVWHPQS